MGMTAATSARPTVLSQAPRGIVAMKWNHQRQQVVAIVVVEKTDAKIVCLEGIEALPRKTSLLSCSLLPGCGGGGGREPSWTSLAVSQEDDLIFAATTKIYEEEPEKLQLHSPGGYMVSDGGGGPGPYGDNYVAALVVDANPLRDLVQPKMILHPSIAIPDLNSGRKVETTLSQKTVVTMDRNGSVWFGSQQDTSIFWRTAPLACKKPIATPVYNQAGWRNQNAHIDFSRIDLLPAPAPASPRSIMVLYSDSIELIEPLDSSPHYYTAKVILTFLDSAREMTIDLKTGDLYILQCMFVSSSSVWRARPETYWIPASSLLCDSFHWPSVLVSIVGEYIEVKYNLDTFSYISTKANLMISCMVIDHTHRRLLVNDYSNGLYTIPLPPLPPPPLPPATATALL